MDEAKVANVSVNTAALQGNYLADIQNLLDVITFVYAGLGSVTEEVYRRRLGFMAFLPADNRSLSYGKAKEKSTRWLLTSFLTDSINTTGNFLDECRRVCAFFRLAGKGKVTGQEFRNVSETDWNRFHKLGFPQKFKHLRDEFGVETAFERHFDSLNKARNCLVHRQGIVAATDTNEDGKLVVTWRVVELFAKSPDGGEEILIDSSTTVEGGWTVYIRRADRQRAFDVGQRIELDTGELYRIVFTLFNFATDLVQSINAYGAAQGVGKPKD